MTSTTETGSPSTGAPPTEMPSAWRRMRVLATAHVVDDFYQGLIPAAVPYFVLERHVGYVGASGLAMAATLGSALPQLLVGLIADRFRLPWLSALGLTLAGLGAGLCGLPSAYALAFACILLSGLGVAIFHPPAGRDARAAACGEAAAMSYFAAGGSVGFFLAPALVTPALDRWGLSATVLFIPPAVLMGFILLRDQRRPVQAAVRVRSVPERDRRGLFAVLTCVEVARSAVSFGINTFVSLYWIRYLGASSGLGGLALALELAGGVIGTLAGGRIADRFGLARTVQIGNTLLVPALLAVLAVHDRYAALPLIFLAGAVMNIPFAVLVKLGQDYLPSRPGTAAGVTLGLAVSAGGLVLPVLGLVASNYGVRGTFVLLAFLPIASIALSTRLREP